MNLHWNCNASMLFGKVFKCHAYLGYGTGMQIMAGDW